MGRASLEGSGFSLSMSMVNHRRLLRKSDKVVDIKNLRIRWLSVCQYGMGLVDEARLRRSATFLDFAVENADYPQGAAAILLR